MANRMSIFLGAVLGLAVAGLIFAALVAFVPESQPRITPPPTAVVLPYFTPPPTPVITPSPTPVSAGDQPQLGSPSPGPSPSAS